jgi:hypothetical protein
MKDIDKKCCKCNIQCNPKAHMYSLEYVYTNHKATHSTNRYIVVQNFETGDGCTSIKINADHPFYCLPCFEDKHGKQYVDEVYGVGKGHHPHRDIYCSLCGKPTIGRGLRFIYYEFTLVKVFLKICVNCCNIVSN